MKHMKVKESSEYRSEHFVKGACFFESLHNKEMWYLESVFKT